MRRHDWMALALIGGCALSSLGLTAMLSARLLDKPSVEVWEFDIREAEGPEAWRDAHTFQFRPDVELVSPKLVFRPRPSPLRWREVEFPRIREVSIKPDFRFSMETSVLYFPDPFAYGKAIRIRPSGK